MTVATGELEPFTGSANSLIAFDPKLPPKTSLPWTAMPYGEVQLPNVVPVLPEVNGGATMPTAARLSFV
jgi:hypothetical protein